jgi:Ca-activated chloride channel family protein
MVSIILAALLLYSTAAPQQPRKEACPGQLTIVDKTGSPAALCPLKGTAATADIAGFGARVTVVQTFVNPSDQPIEAVYTFPLPHDAAVDRMRFKIGSRIIEGVIKRKEEARRIYEAAKNSGQAAALLDQERPNIFTQSVANIMPKAEIQVEISYIQLLKYEGGQFEFTYPMVVGPRFLGNASDPDKIAPPITPEGTRSGATIELTVNLHAGARIESLGSVLHAVSINREGEDAAVIKLSRKDEIPNRDFILRYRTATDSVKSALLTSFDPQKGGFFSLVLLPPKIPAATQIAPREMIFVMDQSGSQSGFPIDKSKELTLKLIKTMRPNDTFNVFGFNNTTRALFQTPQHVTADTLAKAETFVKAMQAGGGTQLLEGLNAALLPPQDPERLRIVVFNTDGFVGDEPQILDSIQKNRAKTRIFTFGIGNGVNRYLIDAMSREGRGDSEVVTLAESADGAVERFAQRMRSPVLTDINVKFDGVEPTEVYPRYIPDVFSDRPIVVYGRYENPSQGRVTLTGRVGGRPWNQTLDVRLPSDPGSSSIMSLWARSKIDDLTTRAYLQMQNQELAQVHGTVPNQITDTALEFGLMSQYTSFVAVEPRIVNVGGRQHTVRVPVEMADGVRYETTVGESWKGQPQPMGGVGGAGGGYAASSGTIAASKSAKYRQVGGQMMDTAQSPNLGQGHKDLDAVIEKSLRAAKGQIDVMVWTAKTDAGTLKALALAGLKVAQVDGKLLLVFGSCDASKLRSIAALPNVERIEALH